MDLIEILQIKHNIFDHILYEFEMYFETFGRLYKLNQMDDSDPVMKNVLLESHAVHLRNLIEFFNCSENCITTQTIFTGSHDLSYDDSKIKAKQTISKTIDHLTKERYTWNQTEQDLTIRYNNIILTMYTKYIPPRIRKCVELLLSEKDVKSEHLDALRETNIQQRLICLQSLFADRTEHEYEL